MSSNDFNHEAADFSDDLKEDEAILASEARVIGALQLQGIFIDMDGCLDLGDKQARLFAERKQVDANLGNLSVEEPVWDASMGDDVTEIDPDIRAQLEERESLRNEQLVLNRKIAIVTRAAGIASAIYFEIDENDGTHSNYPVSSADYQSTNQGVSSPLITQEDETRQFDLHRHVAEIALDPEIILDDRRAFLAAIVSLVGVETYQGLLHDIFRTDRGDTPHIIHS